MVVDLGLTSAKGANISYIGIYDQLAPRLQQLLCEAKRFREEQQQF